MINKELLKEYKQQLEERDKLETELSDKRESLQKKFIEENEKTIGRINILRNSLIDVKNSLTEMGVEEYTETKEKKLTGGLGVRVISMLEYENKEALKWAKEHSICLSLDKRSFDKLAKTQDLEFVQKKETITITFPKEIKLD